MPLQNDALPNVGKLLRKYFFAGVLVLIPIVVILWILGGLISTLGQLQTLMPDAWRPETYIESPALKQAVNFAVMIVATLILALAISLVGWTSRQFLGKKILEGIAHLIQRIPVLRSIYSALDQLLKTLAAGGGSQFSRVVYVEYPRKEMWTLAFVTGPARGVGLAPHHLNIYVPTTPNPTSGFYLIVSESEVRESHLKVEDAFKIILSLGIAQHGAEV